MRCLVRVEIKLKPGLHDPEGVTARSCLHDLGLRQVVEVRSGKVYYMWLDVRSEEEARQVAETACTKLLANPVKDEYKVEVLECREV